MHAQHKNLKTFALAAAQLAEICVIHSKALTFSLSPVSAVDLTDQFILMFSTS